ncbi:MAG: hypothetical protein ACRC7R_09415, partial [Sarcina sp.]
MIKKSLAIILSSLFIFTMGCSKNSDKKANDVAQKVLFDNKISMEIANNYMAALAKGDLQGLKYLSNKDLADGLVIKPDNSMNVVGLRMEESSQRGDSGLYKYIVCKSKDDSANASLEEYYVTVKKAEENYKVDSVKAIPKYSAFDENKSIKLRTKDEVKLNTLVNLKNIPDTDYPKINKGDVSKVDVPKNEFGVLSFSFSGEKIAISTKDGKSSYACVIEIDDAKQTIANGKKEEHGKKQLNEDEKIVGKKITTLDIYDSNNIKELKFTKDDSHVVVVCDVNGATRFNFYKASGEFIPLKLENSFKIDTYNLIFKSYQDDEILFDVEGVKASKEVRQD